MSSSNYRPRRRARLRVALVGMIAIAMAVAGMSPAGAAFKSSSITYTGEKSVTCASGKFGFVYVSPNHVSYKRILWKRNGASHWSNTLWTGYNGGDALVKILPKTGGNRTSRAYVGLAADSKHGMTAKSKLGWRVLCSAKDLTGNPDAYNTNWNLRQLWQKSTWTSFR